VAELHEIQAVVARVRRRLRLQGALEGAATAGILAVAAALVVFWCWRMELVGRAGLWLAGAAALVAAGALLGAARRLPTLAVAARIDAASGLADRLTTAFDFHSRLGEPHHPETLALMRAAIADGVRAVPRANVRAAAPFRAPRDTRALATFLAVGGALAALAFGPTRAVPAAALPATAARPQPPAPSESLDPDDVTYQKEFVEEMRQLAATTQDEALQQMARELQELLDQAARGQIGKQELLAKMEAIEKKYAEGSSDRLDETLADLKDQGKELARNAVTKRLGEAMEKGDLEAAKKELERLAEEIDKGEMKPEDQKKLAEALDKAAAKQEQRQQQHDQKQAADAQKQIEKKKEEIRRLQRKTEQEPQDQEAKRTLEKEKRELERLERDQKEQQEKPKRQLDRLTRNLKQAAEDLKQKNPKQGAQRMRESARESQRIQQEMKKLSNQQRVRTQMQDLKDAIRRARPRQQGGNARELARLKRVEEWERRAGGQQGNPQAWRSMGQGQPGSQGDKGQPGPQQGGDRPGEQWGTEHDPNLTGDPTRIDDAKFKADELRGLHGEGPSRRETILTSAQKGFARTAYRKVYADYKKIVEEVMSQEKVPQGYKYYVKRYFDRIKPHNMD
jgi:hypothetical protein